jgi:hypothetical protein
MPYTPKHAAPEPAIGKHATPAKLPSKSVWRTPADGPQIMNSGDAELLMIGWHSEYATDQGCPCGSDRPWQCSQFVVARIRGMHRTMYVVPMPYDPKVSVHQRYAILTENDDARPDLREGFDGYHTALLFAAAMCATDMAAEMNR